MYFFYYSNLSLRIHRITIEHQAFMKIFSSYFFSSRMKTMSMEWKRLKQDFPVECTSGVWRVLQLSFFFIHCWKRHCLLVNKQMPPVYCSHLFFHTRAHMCFYICNLSSPLQSALRLILQGRWRKSGGNWDKYLPQTAWFSTPQTNYSCNGYEVCLKSVCTLSHSLFLLSPWTFF